MPLIPFYATSKQGFVMFSGGIEREQWYKIGLSTIICLTTFSMIDQSNSEKYFLDYYDVMMLL